MGDTVVIFDLEADGKHKNNDFTYTQVTVACAMVLDAQACLKARTRAERRAVVANGKAFHWWRHEMSGPDKRGEPMAELLKLFDEATLIVAYNGLAYDFPLLLKHYAGKDRYKRFWSHRLKTHDPFSRIKEVVGHWPKLDDLLTANKLQTKSSTGLEAIQMWYDGRHDELLAYCTDDVRLLAELVMLPQLICPKAAVLPETVFGIRPALVGSTCPLGSPAPSPKGSPTVTA